jgi:hypothetical protein
MLCCLLLTLQDQLHSSAVNAEAAAGAEGDALAAAVADVSAGEPQFAAAFLLNHDTTIVVNTLQA